MLEVSEREEGVVAIHLPIGSLKNPALGWSRYRDANPVPQSEVLNNKQLFLPGVS